MKIYKMRVNHVEEPRGFWMDRPVFSWITTETKGKWQTGARLLIAGDAMFGEVLYDSGMRGDISSLGFAPEFSPEPCTEYYWKVMVQTDAGELGESPAAVFETGRMGLPWTAKWITASFDKEIHPLFQKNFQVDGEVEKARIYVTGLGLFELYINGERVSEEYLAPFATDYDSWVQYMTYDITSYLKQGLNGVGGMLGNGWYKGRFGFEDGMRELYGDRFLFLCQVEIFYRDGRRGTIGTDGSWKCAPSPIVESSIYDGEIYDANKEIPGFSEGICDFSGFSDAIETDGPKGKLQSRLSLPVKEILRRQPEKVLCTPAGELVLDFGQVMTGWVEAECSLEKGKELILEYGELLQNGNFYQGNLRTAKQRYCYRSDGRRRTIRPHFTFYGFRYVKVEGLKEVRPEWFTACVLCSSLEETGEIRTSDWKVNRLLENTKWGQRGNFLDIPTDCPQRDERMGWTGDAQIFSATASFHMYTPAFYRKYLYDVLKEQQKLGGSVPFVVPDVIGQIQQKHEREDRRTLQEPDIWGDEAHGSCAWGDAAAVIPWTLYLFYGDKHLLQEEYPNMKGWIDFIRGREGDRPGEGAWVKGFHFGDWLALDNPDPDSRLGGTDTCYVALACYYASTVLTAKAAGVLGLEEDRKNYEELAGKIRENFAAKHLKKAGTPDIDTQTALVLALKFGLVPEEKKGEAVKRLLEKLKEKGGHLDTGFVGTPYLCPVLSENGQDEWAYSLLLNEEFPGWLYEVNLGATTVWERWNSLLPDGTISDTGMNSMNHYAYGAVAEWMYRYMCGINPMEETPGFKRARLTPRPDKRMSWAEARYQSASGEYRCGWRIKEEGICYRIQVPFDCSAEFVLPGKVGYVCVNGQEDAKLLLTGQRTFEAGDYEICVFP